MRATLQLQLKYDRVMTIQKANGFFQDEKDTFLKQHVKT